MTMENEKKEEIPEFYKAGVEISTGPPANGWWFYIQAGIYDL